MLVQHKVIEAAKGVITSVLANNGVTTWQVYGQFDQTDTQGVLYPHVRVLCYDAERMRPAQKDEAMPYKAHLEIMTNAIRVVGDNNQGTTANEFLTVSDYVFNVFNQDDIEAIMTNSGSNITFKLITEEPSETTPITDGYYATNKFEVVCSRTS